MIQVDEGLDAPGSKLDRLRAEGIGLPEAAKRLGRCERTVLRLVYDGVLPAIKEGGRWRFLPEHFDEYVERCTVNGPGGQPGRGE